MEWVQRGCAYRVVNSCCADGVGEVDEELQGEDQGEEIGGHVERLIALVRARLERRVEVQQHMNVSRGNFAVE